MAKETCQLCGRRHDPKTMVEHHIVPTQVTAEGGIPESQSLRLCANCHQEVHTWYVAKVRHTEYDPDSRRFRNKSSLEMVREYQMAFSNFVNYRRAQRKRSRRS